MTIPTIQTITMNDVDNAFEAGRDAGYKSAMCTVLIGLLKVEHECVDPPRALTELINTVTKACSL